MNPAVFFAAKLGTLHDEQDTRSMTSSAISFSCRVVSCSPGMCCTEVPVLQLPSAHFDYGSGMLLADSAVANVVRLWLVLPSM